ncbi:MAG: hypothetical protein QXK36_02980, partial [Candidatus Bathyarchaeia archaeon]
ESSNSQITKNESSKENSENPEALEMEKSPKEKLVGRAGFEPATYYFGFFLKNKDLNRDLDGFRLFCVSKLNLSLETAKNYVRKVRAFLWGRESHKEN